jgi:hypothetical protein
MQFFPFISLQLHIHSIINSYSLVNSVHLVHFVLIFHSKIYSVSLVRIIHFNALHDNYCAQQKGVRASKYNQPLSSVWLM